MKTCYFVLAISGAVMLYGCKDSPSSSRQPEERIVGIGNLVSDEFIKGDWIDFQALADSQSFGFDADQFSRNVYVPIEAGKSNKFRVKDDKGAYKIAPGDGGLIDSVIDRGPFVPYTHVIAVKANSATGSEKLKIYCDWEEAGKVSLQDISAMTDDSGKAPISIYAKVYTPTKLPIINVFYLYGTATIFPNLIDTLNKIYYQTVCYVDTYRSVNLNPDKAWDKNGNGQLDVYGDSTDPRNELQVFRDWAKSSPRNYWADTAYGAIVLDKHIIDHTATSPGDSIKGVTINNLTVLGSDANYTVVAHEFLHSYSIHIICKWGFLQDVIDEYNLMNYALSGNRVLRYRSEIRYYSSDIEPSQWQNLTNTSY